MLRIAGYRADHDIAVGQYADWYAAVNVLLDDDESARARWSRNCKSRAKNHAPARFGAPAQRLPPCQDGGSP